MKKPTACINVDCDQCPLKNDDLCMLNTKDVEVYEVPKSEYIQDNS